MNAQPVSVWILGDQLLVNHPALAWVEKTWARAQIRIIMIESERRLTKRLYQRKKLVLLLSAMRHYAQELRDQGYTVDYVKSLNFAGGLRTHVQKFQPQLLVMMLASDFNGRRFQQDHLPQVLGIPVKLLPNSQYLVGQYNPIPSAKPGQRHVMERFYRQMRRHFRVLLDDRGEPLGGQWNFDQENRKKLPKGLVPPEIPRFAPTPITAEVQQQVRQMRGLGTVDDFQLAVTRDGAETAFADFLAHRLAFFGPYEDAMSQAHGTLFHSVLSPYLNLGLLEPMRLIRAVEHAYHNGIAPINSVEGFIRQVLGWREYVYWQYWLQMPGLLEANHWQAMRPLPEWFWHGETELYCLQQTLARALATGYSHHIERLMLICNFCLLSGIQPRQVHDWFLASYIDAYEWVMAPNVMGMGLHADGGRIATKPYIASANYIHRMGDFCSSCRFEPGVRVGPNACPFNFLYWHFLLEHEEVLRANPRLGKNVLGLRHLGEDERGKIRQQAVSFLSTLHL